MATLLPFGLRRFWVHATVAKEGTLDVVTGTVRIGHRGATADVAADSGAPILEGYTIKTDNTSRALITLFDGSTILIFENSEFTVLDLRRSRFTQEMTQITLEERLGRLRVGVAPPTTRQLRFVVKTPQAEVALDDGSYAIEVGAQGSALSVRVGAGVVTSAKSSVAVVAGQRSTVAAGKAPSPAGPAALDLVLNSSFVQRDVGWTARSEVETGRTDDIPGQTIFQSDTDTPSVRFLRRGSRNSHGENGVYQAINRDVSDFVTLKLSLDFRLIYQSLSGGGYLGSEYPLMVLVTYRDEKGTQVTWARGFYYQNDAGYPTTYGEQMPVDIWIPYEKDLKLLEGYPTPYRLLSVEVLASGWDYESLVKSVSILAE